MVFVIQGDEPLADGVRRMAQEQLADSIALLSDEMADRDDAVHSTRKSIKRIRALLRLVRKPLGEETYKHENTTYRDIARQLASVRDAYIKIEAFDRVVEQTSVDAGAQDMATIREKLVEQYELVRTAFWADSNKVATVIEALEAQIENIGQWSLQKDGFSLIAQELIQNYKRGMREMQTAYSTTPDPELFHEWRKRVKYQWHQLEVLVPIWPEMMTALTQEWHQLSQELGDAHDLAVLYDDLIALSVTDDGNGRALIAKLDYRQAQHESTAYELGRRLYAEDPKSFVNRLDTYWQIWQSENAVSTLPLH